MGYNLNNKNIASSDSKRNNKSKGIVRTFKIEAKVLTKEEIDTLRIHSYSFSI